MSTTDADAASAFASALTHLRAAQAAIHTLVRDYGHELNAPHPPSTQAQAATREALRCTRAEVEDALRSLGVAARPEMVVLAERSAVLLGDLIRVSDTVSNAMLALALRRTRLSVEARTANAVSHLRAALTLIDELLRKLPP